MGHELNPGYIPGDHWNTCHRCGFDIRNSESLKEWNGLIVCEDCYEPRHEADFVRAHPEDTSAQGLVTSDLTGDMQSITLHDNDSPTLTLGTSTGVHDWNTALTANRAITLSNGSSSTGRFEIYRTAGGAYTLAVGSVYTIPASMNMLVVVEYYNGAWHLESTTYLD